MTSDNYRRYWRRSRIRFLALALGGFPVYLLSKLFPKNNSIWVYGSQNGFRIGDNSYYHFIEPAAGIRKIFITKNPRELYRTELLPGEYHLTRSWKGFWFQLRAGKVFYSHSIFDLTSPLACGSRVTCFQHGYPIKLGGAADPKNRWVLTWPLGWFLKVLFPYVYYYYAHEVWTPGGIFESNSRAVFSFTAPELVVKKSPRLAQVKVYTGGNKILVALTHSSLTTLCEKLDRLGLLKDSEPHNLNHISPGALSRVVVRPHPIDNDPSLQQQLATGVGFDTTISLYESFGHYDAVITDFSSIGFDAIELGIKAYFWTESLDDFLDEEIGLFDSVIDFMKNNGLDSSDKLWREVFSDQT